MKKTLFSVIILALVAACTPQSQHDGYTIKGKIAGIETGKIIIVNASKENPIADTTEIKKGKFTFTGKVATPEAYYLIIEGKEYDMQDFFLDNGTITIAGHIDSLYKIEIIGTAATTATDCAMQKTIDSIYHTALPYDPNELLREYRNPETVHARRAEIERLFNGMEQQMEELEKYEKSVYTNYIKENLYSPYAVWLLRRYFEEFAIADLTVMLDSLQQQPALQGNRFVPELAEIAVVLKNTGIGQTAPNFTLNTPDDKPVTFSDVYKKNKLTMIDFWASWCGPCRRFNPALVKLYNKYHKKGFEILAVSLDKSKDSWVQAIASDKLTWLHVSDLQFWNSEIAKLYNIAYIPQNIFVNANGAIIAKRIAENELDAFIANQLK